MDELQLLREFFGERPPPAPDVVSAAKARLSRGEPPRRWRQPRRRHPSRRALLRFGLPATAIAACAAVFIAIAVQAPPAPAPAPAPGGAVQGGGLTVFRLPSGAAGAQAGSGAQGRTVLLAAARRVARAAPPPATGRYWVTPAVVGNFLKVGPAGDRYMIVEEVGTQQWAAMSPRDFSPSIEQALSVQLASPADQRAWRRDGSPAKWPEVSQETGLALPQGMASTGYMEPVSAGRGKPTTLDASLGSQPFQVGNKALSLSQLRALPADPARLKALIMSAWSRGQESTDFFLFQAVPAVLEMPVTPAVRSALYRMLAGLPGVRSLGTVRDVSGRRGAGVAVTGHYSDCGGERYTFSSCVVQESLIIDRGTGLPLAEELRYVKVPSGQTWSGPDGLFSYEIFAGSHWTNVPPA
jgi:hypothetical protein